MRGISHPEYTKISAKYLSRRHFLIVWCCSIVRSSALPPEAFPGQDEEHDHHVGRDPDAGHQEEDGGGGLGVLLADDDRHIGRVVAAVAVAAQARDGP